MDESLRVINNMKEDGVIRDYAIGGAVAVMFYTEPIVTVDLDIIFIPIDEEKSILEPIPPVYKYLEERGYEPYKEYIMIEGVPVQFIPVYNELVLEAVIKADDTTYEDIKTRVLKPEYIIAIYMQLNRRKDREKIALLFEQEEIDEALLEDILRRHSLYEKYIKTRRWYHE
jgi:hypothetical protein